MYKISLLNILMIFGIKEKLIILPVQYIVGYCYKYTCDLWLLLCSRVIFNNILACSLLRYVYLFMLAICHPAFQIHSCPLRTETWLDCSRSELKECCSYRSWWAGRVRRGCPRLRPASSSRRRGSRPPRSQRCRRCLRRRGPACPGSSSPPACLKENGDTPRHVYSDGDKCGTLKRDGSVPTQPTPDGLSSKSGGQLHR